MTMMCNKCKMPTHRPKHLDGGQDIHQLCLASCIHFSWSPSSFITKMSPTLRSFKCMMWWSAATLVRSSVAFSQVFPLDETWSNHQQCVDLYGQEAFDPRSESSITVVLEPQNRVGIVSVVIFELGGEHLGGIVRPGTHEVGSPRASIPVFTSSCVHDR